MVESVRSERAKHKASANSGISVPVLLTRYVDRGQALLAGGSGAVFVGEVGRRSFFDKKIFGSKFKRYNFRIAKKSTLVFILKNVFKTIYKNLL